MPDTTAKFAGLGAYVLILLERDKDWNPDTLGELATMAELSGLAETDETGHFRVCREVKPCIT